MLKRIRACQPLSMSTVLCQEPRRPRVPSARLPSLERYLGVSLRVARQPCTSLSGPRSIWFWLRLTHLRHHTWPRAPHFLHSASDETRRTRTNAGQSDLPEQRSSFLSFTNAFASSGHNLQLSSAPSHLITSKGIASHIKTANRRGAIPRPINSKSIPTSVTAQPCSVLAVRLISVRRCETPGLLL